jgi:hypothetical protein
MVLGITLVSRHLWLMGTLTVGAHPSLQSMVWDGAVSVCSYRHVLGRKTYSKPFFGASINTCDL